MISLEKIAEQYRVKIKTDECGDAIIPGRHGQVYVDDGTVCLMRLDAPPVKGSRLRVLGGKVWQGDISQSKAGRKVQDIRMQAIADDKIGRALRLAGVKPRRIPSPAQRLASQRAVRRALAARGIIRPEPSPAL